MFQILCFPKTPVKFQLAKTNDYIADEMNRITLVRLL